MPGSTASRVMMSGLDSSKRGERFFAISDSSDAVPLTQRESFQVISDSRIVVDHQYSEARSAISPDSNPSSHVRSVRTTPAATQFGTQNGQTGQFSRPDSLDQLDANAVPTFATLYPNPGVWFALHTNECGEKFSCSVK